MAFMGSNFYMQTLFNLDHWYLSVLLYRFSHMHVFSRTCRWCNGFDRWQLVDFWVLIIGLNWNEKLSCSNKKQKRAYHLIGIVGRTRSIQLYSNTMGVFFIIVTTIFDLWLVQYAAKFKQKYSLKSFVEARGNPTHTVYRVIRHDNHDWYR